jgi:hypothetical protein
MKKNLYFLDENAREIFWYTLEQRYDLFYSTAIKNKISSLSELCYNNNLQLKSILLNSNITLLISLWDVLVEYTGRFISQFYRELLSDKHPSKQKAFRAAQLYM